MAKSLTVVGPYPNRDKWRIVLMDGSGRQSKIYDTREEAEAIKARLQSDARAKYGKTIEESLYDYAEYRVKYRGVKAATAEDHCRHLRTFLPVELPIVALNAERASRLYLEYAERPNRRNGRPLSPNTHHWVLLIAKCWAKWCVKMGHLISNPFANVEPIGKRNAGKTQHTVDEAQRFNGFLLERAAAGERAAVGVLLMLHLGLRKGEVAARVARDIDAEGQILIVPFGKTESSRRRVKVPKWLQPVLRKLVSELSPDELLFSVDGQPVSHSYFWRKVQEYCAQAGVPKVCPHSLRGLHATLALEQGATSDAVALALGHTSFTMTAKHYASADSVMNARVARAEKLLAPKEPRSASEESAGDAEHADRNAVDSFLSNLTPQQLEHLRRRLVA